MKYIRNILLFLTIFFAFVMQAEVYQNMLWNFSGAYYLSSAYETDDGELESFLADAEAAARAHRVSVFSVFCQRISNYQTRLTVYGKDAAIRDSLKSTMDVEEKTYTALIGGITAVEFADFQELRAVGCLPQIMLSYIGDEEDITAVYEELAETYSLTPPAFWQSTEEDMMTIVWGLVAILMLVLNAVEIVRRQKEVVVRASLGESAGTIAVKAAVTDLISYAVVFVLARRLVSRFISGSYAKTLVLAIYGIGAVLSVLPYLAFVRFDVRKAFANASDRKGMLYLLNGLKVLAAAMTVFTITTNLGSIQGNLLASSDILKHHFGDSYFGVIVRGDPLAEDGGRAAEEAFWDALYEKEYETIRPILCVGCWIGDGGNYIFVNHNGKDMLQGFSELLTPEDESSDIVIFVPGGRHSEEYRSTARQILDNIVKNAAELDVVFHEYSGRQRIYFLNSNREDAVDGLSGVKNPVVLYQASEAAVLSGSSIEMGTHNGEVIYGCGESTLREAASKYAEPLGSYNFILTNVGEDYAYSHSFLVKLIGFISSLCVLVLLLDLAVVLSEVKMEFRVRAMELSLKKVLGYRFYERYRRFLSVHLIENAVVTAAVCVVSLFMSHTSALTALLVGVLLTAAEMAIIFTNILWIEKTDIAKSLKGGCL